MGSKRTKREPIHHCTGVYDVDLSDVPLTSTNSVQRIQIVSVPDDRNRRDALSGEPLEARKVREELVRDPVEIVDCSPESAVVATYRPYGIENAFSKAIALARREDLPIAEEIVTLRPDHWTDSERWATCPECSSDELLLVSDLDDSSMTLACRSCDERAQSGTDWKEMHYEWFHCPGCGSGDVNVELSCPYGSVWWNCDDRGYDTLPTPPATAYTRPCDAIEDQER